jgi:branched-subunit amino acid ABC-type transport system permease component
MPRRWRRRPAPSWLALVASLVAAALAGALVELTVMRRLYRATISTRCWRPSR